MRSRPFRVLITIAITANRKPIATIGRSFSPKITMNSG